MITIIRVSVLLIFAIFAAVLASKKERHRMTYRLILVFVALGVTTLLPDDAIMMQVTVGFLVFLLLSAVCVGVSRGLTLRKKQ